MPIALHMLAIPVCSTMSALAAHIRMMRFMKHDAEALAEALYLFRCPSSLAQTDRIAKHCLLLSLTEAHNMAISWPYPILPASANQVKDSPSRKRRQTHRQS